MSPLNRRLRRRSATRGLVVVIAIVFAFSCSGGGGCSGCGITPIPGGFPAAKRVANAGQARVTSTALAKLTADPGALLGTVLGSAAGSGTISFPVESCSSSLSVCCDSNGNMLPNCGPVNIAIDTLQITPQTVAAPNGAVQVTVNARVKSANPLTVTVLGFATCTVALDTTAGTDGNPDLTLSAPITLDQDGPTGTTKIAVGSASISGIGSGDLVFGPNSLCQSIGSFVPISTLEGFFTGPITDAISGALAATCKKCVTNADCGFGNTVTCSQGTCMEGSACYQEVGIDGQLAASSLFASFSPGTSGGLDLYEVAGGYSTTSGADANGISLGLLGGMEPAGSARDMCGPPATEPAMISIPRSPTFEGNTYQGSAFDFGIGIHKSQLAQLAYAGYEGGVFCLTLTHDKISQLDTDTIGLLSRSLTKLVENDSPMAIGLRPQSPPTITLGKNTFTTNGSGDRVLQDPLLDVKFSALELDFFAEVDYQWIRVFTVVADVDLPVGIDTGMGGAKLTPVLGDTTNAFSNVSVKNSEAVTESPDTLASLFPTLLGLVLPQLSSALPSIAIPSLAGINLTVDAVTAVDDLDNDGTGDFLAIFADIAAPAMNVVRPHTTIDVTSVDEPDTAIARDATKWASSAPPRIVLSLGALGYDPAGQDPSRLEFSLRIDRGVWTPWSKNPNPALSPRTFWLPGIHDIEVRSRLAGQPDTVDLTGARISVPIGIGLLPQRGLAGSTKLADPFHGTEGAQGCQCNAGGNNFGAAAPFALIFALLVLPLRRMRRGLKRLGAIVWLTALACLPGCSCNSKPCGGSACMDGTQTGSIGRWTSIAGDDQRVMVATYDQKFGDLVVGDATDAMNVKYTSIDGVPDSTPTYDPSSWRGGVTDPGPDVGAWTSIALANHTARVAYQDRDDHVLKYAYESGGNWTNYVVDPGQGTGEDIGQFTRMIVDGSQHPAIAYLAIGVDDGMGHRTTELRLARASGTDPQGAGDWTISTIVSGVGSCAGLCSAGDSCVSGSDGETCITPTTDCSAACASGDVCENGACVTALAAPTTYDVPSGTGMFDSLVLLGDGRLAVTYYDGNARALVIGVESSAGTSQFTPTVLDGNSASEDRGMWSTAAVASDGTVHVVYQDALGDQVMYTTWSNGTPGTPEVVDTGVRTGDRPHPVGAAAALWLVNDAPVVAYQDGLASDVDVATRMAPGAWNMNDLASGPLLDGFFIAVTTGHGSPVLAWDSLDPADTPVHNLVLATP